MTKLIQFLFAIFGILPLLFSSVSGIAIPDISSSVLSVRRLGVERQPANGTITQHHNAGFFNAAGRPFELEYADPEQKVIKSFGSNYNFSDLFTLDDFFSQADDGSLSDGAYYEFSDSNIDASQHAMFYALWSILRQDTPAFEKYGEWGAFAAEYMDTFNSRCGHDDSHCKEVPSLDELKRMYPGQRPKVRLVYFTAMKMTLFHDMQVAIEGHINRVHANMILRIPTLVQTFTHQVDHEKLKWCAWAHSVVDTATDVGIKLAFIGLDTLIPGSSTAISIVAPDPNTVLGAIKNAWKVRDRMFVTGKSSLAAELEEYGRRSKEIYEATKPPPYTAMKTFTFDPWKDHSRKLETWGKMAGKALHDKYAQDIGLEQGYSSGYLCGAWEGDDSDRNPANIRRLQDYISTYFGMLERGTREQYSAMYNGYKIAPGKPTLMALYGMNLKWSGDGSVFETLKNMEPLKEAISSELEKKLISTTSRRDGNYQHCVHRGDAPDLCKAARKARASGKDADSKVRLTTAMRSLVCPLPETDPTLVCQGGRWYWSRDFAHTIGFSSLDSISGYHGAGLDLTYESAVTEAFANYQHLGNDMGDNTEGWSLGHVSGTGLRMPFCVTERKWVDIQDFTWAAPHQREGKQWQFPGICGPNGKETEGFLAAIDSGVGSKNWQANNPTRQYAIEFLSLYYDRLPRIYNRLSPALSYLQYGRVGMQFPYKDPSTWYWQIWHTITMNPLPAHKRYQVTKGRDLDFAAVQGVTSHMDEFAANVWFCLDGTAKHTVFKRERSHVDLIKVPSRRIENHAGKCKQWLKEHGLEVEVWKKTGHHP